MTYLGKCKKAYMMRHNFLLVIFLTIFPKLVLIYIKWKIAKLAKTNIEVSFKKIHALTLKTYFKKHTV